MKINTLNIIIILFLLFPLQVKAYEVFQERVYLQTDKDLYIAGELLWMKLYTTDGDGKLIPLSKVGYVELLSDSIPEVQVKMDITNGTGAGWIELPSLLPTGYYRLIAYTRYMRNEKKDVFFEKLIRVINPFSRNDYSNPSFNENSSIFDRGENKTTSIQLFIDKTKYAKREKGEIRIAGLPVENISLGISIAGVDPFENQNTGIDKWKQQLPQLKQSQINNKLLPEYEGIILEGKLIDLETGELTGNPNITTILSFPGDNFQFFTGKINDNGDISFFTQYTTGKHEIATTAIDPFGKKYRVDIQSPFIIHSSKELPHLKTDSSWLGYLQKRNLGVQVIQAYIADSMSKIKETQPYSYLRPSRQYILDNYTRFPVMEDLFTEFIMVARIRTLNGKRTFFTMTEDLNGFSNGNVLVLLDNIPVTNHELMIKYDPLLIKKIDIYLGRYIFGGQPFDGIIAFSSYHNNYPGITFEENTQLFDYDGTQPYRYFYAPSYEEESSNLNRMPDFRHTLLWEPSIESNYNQELIIPFYTSDFTGDFVITVEGIGKKGTIINETYRFKITD